MVSRVNRSEKSTVAHRKSEGEKNICTVFYVFLNACSNFSGIK